MHKSYPLSSSQQIGRAGGAFALQLRPLHLFDLQEVEVPIGLDKQRMAAVQKNVGKNMFDYHIFLALPHDFPAMNIHLYGHPPVSHVWLPEGKS